MSNKYYTFVGVIADKIYHRYVEDGIRKSEVVENFKFELFVKAHHGTHTSLFGDKLARMEFTSITEMKEFHRSHSRMGEVFGNTSPVHQFIAKTYPGELVAEGKDYVVLNYDIETAYDDATGFSSPADASNQVMSINMKVFGDTKSYTMGLKAYEPADENDIYYHCYSEKDLLLKFINKWEELNPDYVTGWSIKTYDNVYIINRIKKILGTKAANRLSPFHAHSNYVIKDKKTKDAYGNETPEYEIFGVTTLDYIELYKKYAPAKLESYRLEFVSQVENGTGKIPYDEYGSIQNMFDGNYKIQKYVDKETLPEKDRWCRNRTIVEAEMERRQKLKEVAND